MKKHIITLILCITLCGLFTACGSLLESTIGGGDTPPPETQVADTTSTPTPSPEPSPDNGDPDPGTGGDTSAAVNIGDVIPFGGHSWLVLDVQDGKALIISEYILENRPYHEPGGEITWEDSTIRAYLNGEFYDGFDQSDRAWIVETTVTNGPQTHGYGTPGGNDTLDKIFLLSADEYVGYDYPSVIGYVDGVTGIGDYDYGAWWLRSPGGEADRARIVGGFGDDEVDVKYDRGVRPALWLNLQYPIQVNGGTDPGNGGDPAGGNGGDTSASADIGDVIPFGGHSWLVLDVQDGKALIISEYILEKRPYHEPGDEITWEDSTLRAYLNGEFYEGFNQSESERIVETKVLNYKPSSHMYGYYVAGGNDTLDKIFLLSFDEALDYFPTAVELIAYGSDGKAESWWFRAPGGEADNAMLLSVNNANEPFSQSNNVESNNGVRPALWLELP